MLEPSWPFLSSRADHDALPRPRRERPRTRLIDTFSVLWNAIPDRRKDLLHYKAVYPCTAEVMQSRRPDHYDLVQIECELNLIAATFARYETEDPPRVECDATGYALPFRFRPLRR